MSFKSMSHQGREVWRNWTEGKKRIPQEYNRLRQKGRKTVRTLKRLSSRAARQAGKRELDEQVRDVSNL